MNLEEAKLNTGKEVVLDESTKPYTTIHGDSLSADVVRSFIGRVAILTNINQNGSVTLNFYECGKYVDFWTINPKHLKLKEQPMQNYKIKVTPETSAEVQKMFFELGGRWNSGSNIILHPKMPYLFLKNKIITFVCSDDYFNESEQQEITLPQLRDLVVLKRNDVNDATHAIFSTKYYVGYDVYEWKEGEWHKSDFETQTIKVGGCSLKSDAEITWEEALQHFLAGRDIEMLDSNNQWEDMEEFYLHDIATNGSKFRLKPKTIHIESGDYTKDEINSLLEKFND